MAYTITFITGKDRTSVASQPGENLLDVARRAGAAVDAPCNGGGVCGKCRIRLLSGSAESARPERVSQRDCDDGWRLACSTAVSGDAVFEIPGAVLPGMKIAGILEDGQAPRFKAYNALRILEISLGDPSDDSGPDARRLVDAVSAELGIQVRLTLPALRSLPVVLRENGFSISAVCDTGTGIIYSIAAPGKARALGVCCDIGTTSVAALLVDLVSGDILASANAGNAQTAYGADVINRIIESSRDGGLDRLREAVMDKTLLPLLAGMCGKAEARQGDIVEFSLAANTTMTHLFFGVYADAIRMEPYVPAFFEAAVTAASLGLPIHPDALVRTAPAVGSYVGGDITAGILASTLRASGELTLFIDLGTNGELVLGSSDFMMTCACSAGPAFEGGEISCGMRASEGAIEACIIDAESLEPSFSVVGGGLPRGICGSGIIDIAAELFRTGSINAKGAFNRENPRIVRDEHGIARYILAYGDRANGIGEISVSEVDISCLIHAKAAIFSAVETMLESIGMEFSEISRVIIAGGIGGGINIDNAVRIGMLPDLRRSMFSYIGNASLGGAYAALISADARNELDKIGDGMTYLELSAAPGYMERYVAACFLPHTNAGLFPSA